MFFLSILAIIMHEGTGKLKEYYTGVKYSIWKKNLTLPFSASDLNLLKEYLPRIQESLTYARLGEFKTTLDQLEHSMNKIQTDRRTFTWVDTGSEILRYFGYIGHYFSTDPTFYVVLLLNTTTTFKFKI